MEKRKLLILGVCVLLLSMAAYAYAQGPIGDPSFENYFFDPGTPYFFYCWNFYSYSDTPADPQIGGIGPGAQFDSLYPSYVPDGVNVCGLQSSVSSKNGGVYQTFYWSGGPANITVTARAYSMQLPENGGLPFDNGCRVRMALVLTDTPNRDEITQWITFPWSEEWQTMKVSVPGAGYYTLFIEGYQPMVGISSTLWDNVVLTPVPSVVIQQGPTTSIDTTASHPDTTMVVEWTTDVPSSSRVEYGTDTSYGQVANDDTLVTNHRVVINNLTPSTAYHCRVTSGAPDYLDITSKDVQFKTPINFSDIAAKYSPDGLSMVITWTTDIPTTSQVAYGETACDTLTQEDTQLTTSHSVSIIDLRENRDYKYQVIGRNKPGYTDAYSAVFTFHTIPDPVGSLVNGDFEQLHSGVHSIYPWVQYDTLVSGSGVSPIDGLVNQPYPAGGDAKWYANIQAYDGSYFIGAAARFAFKNGGVYQRIVYPAGSLCTLSAHYATYSLGGGQADTLVRLGIDPDGGIDPESPNVKWWVGASPTNDSQWHAASITTVTGSRGVVTAFLDIQQHWAIAWHIVAIDGATLGTPPSRNIGELKSSATSSAVLENKIVTCVDESGITLGDKHYIRVYLEDENRASGICALLDQSDGEIPAVGNKITAYGYIETLDKEAVFIASHWSVDYNSYPLHSPLAMSQKFIGGKVLNQPAMYASNGLCNVGLRVRLFGRVDPAGLPAEGNPQGCDSTIYFDDGSKLLDHTPLEGESPVYGIRAVLKGNYNYGVKPGDYIAVTGVLTIRYLDPDNVFDSGDEYYAYTVITASPDDWGIVSPAS